MGIESDSNNELMMCWGWCMLTYFCIFQYGCGWNAVWDEMYMFRICFLAVSLIFKGGRTDLCGEKWGAERKMRKTRRLLGVLWSFLLIEDVLTVIVWYWFLFLNFISWFHHECCGFCVCVCVYHVFSVVYYVVLLNLNSQSLYWVV